MSNLVPNKARSSLRSQIIGSAVGCLDKQNANDKYSARTSEKDPKNASIINVDDESCDVILNNTTLLHDHSGYHKKIHSAGLDTQEEDDNICKLFVKEGTPPKLRRKDNIVVMNKEIADTSLPINSVDQCQIKDFSDENLVSLIAESKTTILNRDTEILLPAPIMPLLPNPNVEYHKEEFKVDDHQFDVLRGLNQLRNDGNLLDVTLWAENRPFQVRIEVA